MAVKALETIKSDTLVETFRNKKSMSAAQGCRKSLKHVPIYLEHHSSRSETHFGPL